MWHSRVGYQQWLFAIYLMTTNLKGVSSLKLHRDLGMTQKTAWLLAQKIRQGLSSPLDKLGGEVEADETFMGGKEKNKRKHKRVRCMAGTTGKEVVMGMRERGGRVIAKPVISTGARALQEQVRTHVRPGSTLYTDENPSYKALGREYNHQTTNHSVGKYVDGMAHTNGIESFWALLKRGYYGTYHQMSAKHLHRYIGEFTGRHNIREKETLAQMIDVAKGFIGKRLPYKELVR